MRTWLHGMVAVSCPVGLTRSANARPKSLAYVSPGKLLVAELRPAEAEFKLPLDETETELVPDRFALVDFPCGADVLITRDELSPVPDIPAVPISRKMERHM